LETRIQKSQIHPLVML